MHRCDHNNRTQHCKRSQNIDIVITEEVNWNLNKSGFLFIALHGAMTNEIDAT